MNDEDRRDCFAFMLTVGFAMKGEVNPKAIWEIADMIVEARKPQEIGIKTVRKARSYAKNNVNS